MLLPKLLEVYGGWIPDKHYLQIMFFLQLGKILHFKNPVLFNEKLQWLKIYNRHTEYSLMVDKYSVKDFVANIIGREHIIPTLDVYDKPEDIKWEKLPNRFVLKTTHGGGNKGIIMCNNKDTLDKVDVLKKLHFSLKQNLYRNCREWPYKNVKPRIIIEQYMVNGDDTELKDYKFYCFNGKAEYCQLIADRSTNETIDFYDREWNHQDFIGLFGLNSKASFAIKQEEKPSNYSEMLIIADKIAAKINCPFVRIDLYNINAEIFFGEITFFPLSGFGSFTPQEWNKKLGDLIILT